MVKKAKSFKLKNNKTPSSYRSRFCQANKEYHKSKEGQDSVLNLLTTLKLRLIKDYKDTNKSPGEISNISVNIILKKIPSIALIPLILLKSKHNKTSSLSISE